MASTTRIAEAAGLVAAAAAIARATVTGDLSNWTALGPVSAMATAAALVAVAATRLLVRGGCHCHHHDPGHDHHHDHDHGHGGHTRWLPAGALAGLTAVIALVCPPALSPTSLTDATAAAVTTSAPATWPPLAAGTPEISLREVAARSAAPADDRIRGRRVRITGVLSHQDGTPVLSRVSIICCAADARTYRVELSDTAGRLADADDGQWLEVTAELQPGSATAERDYRPRVGVVSATAIADAGYDTSGRLG